MEITFLVTRADKGNINMQKILHKKWGYMLERKREYSRCGEGGKEGQVEGWESGCIGRGAYFK